MSEFGFLKEFGFWGAFLFTLIALLLRLFGSLNRDESRGRWIAWLRHDRFARRYRELLDAGLNWLDRRLSPDFPHGPTDRAGNRKIEPGRAWSGRLLNLCFLLAVVYPVLSVLIDWAVTGDAGSVGAIEVVPEEPRRFNRWLPLLLLTIAIVSYPRTKSLAPSLARTALRVAIVLLGAAGWWILYLRFGAGPTGPAVLLIGMFAVPVFRMSRGQSGAFLVGLVAIGGGIFGVDSEKELYFGFAAIAAIISIHTLEYFINTKNKRFMGAVIISFIIVGYVALLANKTVINKTDVSTIPLLFLSILPVLNAWADFASVGLTRWRLRWGVQGHLILNATIDAVAALAILLLLAFAIIAMVHFVRPAGGAPLLDLPALFAGLRATPGQYWWLGFMLFSTLLPTLIHLAIGAFALFTLASGWIGRPIAAGLMRGDSPEGRAASLALTLCAALAVWLPCLVLWLLLARGGGALLAGLLTACEWFHALLAEWFPVASAAGPILLG